MIKKILLKSGLLTILLIAGSCKEYLYLEPQDAIVKQEFWKTKEQIYSALIGCYASLLDNELSDKMFLWGELRGDLMTPTLTAPISTVDIINGNILESNNVVDWRAFYRTINYCNTLIDFAPEVKNSDPTLEDATLNGYMAEARAIRSLMYFYLVRSFGEVPYKIKATVSDDEDIALAKMSQGEILQNILNDLKIAEANSLITHNNKQYDKGRFTRYSINALQADVYLWSDKYDSCILACDKVINSGQFGLVQDWYRSLFVTGNSNEGIFELQYGNKIHPFFYIFWNRPAFTAQSYVLDEYYTIDPVNPENRDIRGVEASLRADGNIWKYLGVSNTTRRDNAAPYPNWIVYRYADILLMKAEALAQRNEGQAALDLINVIRKRANALKESENGADATDISGIIDYILQERAREFAFEGKRWFDILRVSKRNNYERMDVLLDMVTRSAPPEKQQTILNKYKDINSHYFPIYFYELRTNKKLVQNPFYLK